MTKVIDVKNASDDFNLSFKQLPLPVDDNKVMILQLGEACEYCNNSAKKAAVWSEEKFLGQYNKLSKEEVQSSLTVTSKFLFTSLSQVVRCVGCRRSCERLFNDFKKNGSHCIDPLNVTNNGNLTIATHGSLQSKVLCKLFSTHKSMLSAVVDSIPRHRKSGRCMLHSMEGPRWRAGSHAWLQVWRALAPAARDSATRIPVTKLVVTLDNYLRKHRFCHECKNKVHRAYDVLVGNTSIDPVKEKGYVASLYSGITICDKTHIHVKPDTDFLMNLIKRAEPELQGRRERHAKTLEIAQEEVLTCVGLFLYERMQDLHVRMREEERAYNLLLHIGVDAFKRNLEVAVEEKEGFSKFENLLEELQRQEKNKVSQKEKKSKKKIHLKDEEIKENKFISDAEDPCDDCDVLSGSDTNSSSLQRGRSCSLSKDDVSHPLKTLHQDFYSREDVSSFGGWHTVGKNHRHKKAETSSTNPAPVVGRRRMKATAKSQVSKSSSTLRPRQTSPMEKMTAITLAPTPPPLSPVTHDVPFKSLSPTPPPSVPEDCLSEVAVEVRQTSPKRLECSTSFDSIPSRCSQWSRDAGYSSLQCSSSSSRDSSEVACGDGLCAHDDGNTVHNADAHGDVQSEGHAEGQAEAQIEAHTDGFSMSLRQSGGFPQCQSLQEMLHDVSFAESDEIPEAEVRAWYAGMDSVSQKRAELRRTLKQRFQQLCHRPSQQDSGLIPAPNPVTSASTQ